MKSLNIRLVQPNDGGESTITVIYQGRTYTATESHPMWKEILAGALADDKGVVDLFDIARAVGKRTALSPRISVASGRLFFDGDLIEDALAVHIVRLIEAKEDFAPFVALMENIAMNPVKASRTQLYDFLKKHRFTITEDGMIVGYKGVIKRSGSDVPWESSNAGPAIINGEYHQGGRVPQRPGDVIELPRSEVLADPAQGCGPGLHVASWEFAKGFTSGPTLEVHVHPRDVVSVPSHDDQKVRVCRYVVIGERTKPYTEPVLHAAKDPDAKSRASANLETAVRHPSQRVFDELKATARRRRTGFKKVAERAGLELVTGDGSDRKHWRVKK